MKPQTLADLGDTSGLVEVSPWVSQDRPQLEALAFRLIAAWSQVDREFIHLATSLLHTDFQVVAAVLETVRDGNAKERALRAILDNTHHVDPRLRKHCTNVMNAVSLLRKVRNNYAHHIWCVGEKYPDALLLVKPETLSKLDATQRRWGDKTADPSIIVGVTPSAISYYDRETLTSDLMGVYTCVNAVWLLRHLLLDPEDATTRDALTATIDQLEAAHRPAPQ